MSPDSPIIVLDSGLGGLTVVRALRNVLPGEDILYFGDTARLPYGSKTGATVTGFVQQIIAYLRPYDAKHVVIACNTATALSLPAVRTTFPGLSISGVIEPGAKAATAAAGAKQVPTIAVLATEATIRSKAYERAIHRRRLHARMLLRPAPLLVPIIEEGRDATDPLVRLALQQYLGPLLTHHMDVLVLGCTHYPVYKELICKIVGNAVRVIDSAEQCADDVARRLKIRKLLNDAGPADGTAGQDSPGREQPPRSGQLRCFVTDDPARFQRLAPRFLGVAIDKPAWVAPDELYGHAAPDGGGRLSVPA
ncbi:MAG: murI [Phycisphaerales bacterium]|nr:murI [Phycisphaerales bacterium]